MIMHYYTNYGEFQRELTEYYQSTRGKLQFAEVVNRLYSQGRLTQTPQLHQPKAPSHMDNEAFSHLIDSIYFPVSPSVAIAENVLENEMIPLLRDVFLIRHPRYTRPYLHRHDYVECDYVISGSCLFHFEEEVIPLNEGQMCIIAPHSLHDIEIRDDSTVICIMLRISTFESTFIHLLSRDDVLSIFFRNTMHHPDAGSKYLLFQAESENYYWMQTFLQNAMSECYSNDVYANISSISWITLFFSYLLRGESEEPVFQDQKGTKDFPLIIHYIRQHYQSVTLTELSENFHYTKPHICTMIKQNTGSTFSALLKSIRMDRAVRYLLHTSQNVSQIAETVGYNSPDHFSRVFRSTYGVSPQDYRRAHLVHSLSEKAGESR